MTSPAWADSLRGRVLAGKYRLERPLASGGMGAVFVAEHIALARTVAVKLVLPSRKAKEGALERFRIEARAAARVADDGVVEIFDLDYDAELGPFQVMELLAGEPLSARLERGPLSLPAALAVVLDLLEVLRRVHGAGVVHRDIKPSNVFLEARPNGTTRVKVLDFGIARMRGGDAGEEGLTLPGMTLGTLGYMSPEQLAGHPIDARTDVYASALVLYASLTGRAPNQGLSADETRSRTLAGWAPSLYEAGPELPRAIIDAYDHATLSDPRARTASAEDLASALERAGIAPRHELASTASRGASVASSAIAARDRTTLVSEADAPPPPPIIVVPSRAPIPVTPARGVPPVSAPPRRGSRVWIGIALASLAVALASTAALAFLLWGEDGDAPAAVEAPERPAPARAADAGPLPDPLADLARSDVEEGERALAAGQLDAAERAFTRARDRLSDAPPAADGSPRAMLLGRAFLGLGDTHAAHIPAIAARTRSVGPCVTETHPRHLAATAAYAALMLPRYGDLAECADVHSGRLYEVLADTCGRLSAVSRQEYMRLAAYYYTRASRPGPCYAEARAGLARARANGAPAP